METYEKKYKDLVKRLNKAREEKGVYTFNSKEKTGDKVKVIVIKED